MRILLTIRLAPPNIFFLRKMMDLIPKMLHQEANVGATAFPVRAGSHLTPGTPALELVKSVCATLMLDDDARAQVRLLKSHLIRLVNVREFSKESVRRIVSALCILPISCVPPSPRRRCALPRARSRNQPIPRAFSFHSFFSVFLRFALLFSLRRSGVTPASLLYCRMSFARSATSGATSISAATPP